MVRLFVFLVLAISSATASSDVMCGQYTVRYGQSDIYIFGLWETCELADKSICSESNITLITTDDQYEFGKPGLYNHLLDRIWDHGEKYYACLEGSFGVDYGLEYFNVTKILSETWK